MNKKTKTTMFIAIPLLIFLIINVLWFMHYTKFDDYTKDLPVRESGAYGLEKDGYTYSVSKPSYLYFGGNMSVSDQDSLDTFVIWINSFSNNEYGSVLHIENEEKYSMYVDKNGYLVDNKKNLSDAKMVWDKNKDRVMKLANKAKEFWNFD